MGMSLYRRFARDPRPKAGDSYCAEMLEELLGYLQNRGLGHTTAMLEGAQNTDGVIIIAHTKPFADSLARRCKNARGISLHNLASLRGLRLPILIDNFALQTLLTNAHKRICELEGALYERSRP